MTRKASCFRAIAFEMSQTVFAVQVSRNWAIEAPRAYASEAKRAEARARRLREQGIIFLLTGPENTCRPGDGTAPEADNGAAALQGLHLEKLQIVAQNLM